MSDQVDKGLYENMPDERLMVLTGRGKRTAFVTLIRRHQTPIVNFFRRMGVHNDEEDLAQETFVKVFKYRDRYKPSAKFTTFLYVVARRLCYDYWRKRDKEREGVERLKQEIRPEVAPSKVISDRAARAVEALGGISEDMRSVVVLNVYQGLKYQEIADVLEIPLGTVKTRMFHALRKLKRIMCDDCEDKA